MKFENSYPGYPQLQQQQFRFRTRSVDRGEDIIVYVGTDGRKETTNTKFMKTETKNIVL